MAGFSKKEDLTREARENSFFRLDIHMWLLIKKKKGKVYQKGALRKTELVLSRYLWSETSNTVSSEIKSV